MQYFVIRTGISLFFSIVLFVLFIYTMRRCKPIKIRHRMTYFLPILVGGITLWFFLATTAPKLLDVIQYQFGQTDVKQVKAVRILPFHRVRFSDGATYFYNGFDVQLTENQTYQVTCLPWSHYILSIRQMNH